MECLPTNKSDGEAIQLLTSLAAAGGSDGQNLLPATTTNTPTAKTPIWLPPPSHLAVLASLAVHPAYTTRPQDGTDLRVAGHAMQYLRHVLSVAGPVGAEMATAFAYRDAPGQRPSAAATVAARARARAAGTGNGARQNKNEGAEDGRTGRPRRQLRASAGRASLKSGDYVDSQTMSWSDDDDGDWGLGGAKKKATATRKSKSGSRRRGGGDRDRDRGNDSMDMGGHDCRNGGAANGGDRGDDEDDDDFDAEDNDEDAVSGRMATRDGVWQRGQNFWRVAAWALGCSIQEPARWRCWQPWLALMVDVVEADLAERLADNEDDLYDSLLFQYLCEGGGGVGGNSTTHLRRIAAAILADGSQPTQAREVFDRETVLTGAAAGNTASTSEAAASNPTYNRPKRVLDLDNDKFGDYSDDDESAPSTPESSPSPSPSPFNKKKVKLAPTKTSKRGSRSRAGTLDASTDAVGTHPGFLESLPLRRRLFNLVALGSVHFASAFATTDAVYRSFAEVLRETEISVFAAFIAAPPPAVSSPQQNLSVDLPVSPSHINSPTPDDVFVGLLRHILFTYLPTSAPKPHNVDPVAAQSASAVAAVSPRVLERCFLPFAANTVLLSANVRMALALESLFRLVWQPTTPTSSLSADAYPEDLWSPALQMAAETGVKARENRARSSNAAGASSSLSATTTTKQKSALAVEAYGRDLMQRSGRRLLAMVQLARMDAGEPEMVMGDL